MTGLETIVEQILQEAQKEAEEIKAQAARNADSIIANAKKTVDKMNEETREKVAQAEKSGSFRAKSSSELKKRQAILAAKQSIIGNMPDEEYFQVIVKCLEKSVQPKSGEICFSGKDRKRLTPQTEKQIEQIAAAHGGSLKVSNGNCDIDGGFILIYGGIEENCSFRAMLDANREHLADKVNELLFVDNR